MLWDIYLWQSGNPKLKRISKTAFGGDKDQGDESSSRVVSPTISGDGRFVAFATTAKNMVAGDESKFQDAFLVEVDTGRVRLLSSGGVNFADGDSPIGQGNPIGLTFDGAQSLFPTKASNLGGRLMLATINGGESLAILPLKIDGVETGVGIPRISRGGKCVIFGSNVKLDKRYPSSGIFVSCR